METPKQDAVGDLVKTEVDAQLNAALGRPGARPVNWFEPDPASAAQAWADLGIWVDLFRAELGFDQRVVPPCWYRHTAIVNLLSALRDHWVGAYQGGNLSGPAEWHRSLIPLERRLRDWAARTGCTGEEHRPDPVFDTPAVSADWQQFVSADVARRQTRSEQTNRAAGE